MINNYTGNFINYTDASRMRAGAAAAGCGRVRGGMGGAAQAARPVPADGGAHRAGGSEAHQRPASRRGLHAAAGETRRIISA